MIRKTTTVIPANIKIKDENDTDDELGEGHERVLKDRHNPFDGFADFVARQQDPLEAQISMQDVKFGQPPIVHVDLFAGVGTAAHAAGLAGLRPSIHDSGREGRGLQGGHPVHIPEDSAVRQLRDL